MALLEVQNIRKDYGTFCLQDISFTLPEGYIMGYVGQNGAGKTTTLSMITGLIRPDKGKILLGGKEFESDPVAYRETIGYIGDASYFPAELQLKDIRRILSMFYPTFRPEKFDEMARRWALPEDLAVGKFSRGMKVKLMFCCVIARETSLLVMDEATNGLDPVARRDIMQLLQEYISDGTRSVLFSTHIMEDLEAIADYVFFIEQGKKIFCETREDLLEKYLVVRGGTQDLAEPFAGQLIGLEKTNYNFEGLLDVEAGVNVPEGLQVQKAGIDQIVVHMIEEMQKNR